MPPIHQFNPTKANRDLSRLETLAVKNQYVGARKAVQFLVDLQSHAQFTTTELPEITRRMQDLQTQTLKLRSNAFLKLLKTVPVLYADFNTFRELISRPGTPPSISPELMARQFILFLVGRAQSISPAAYDRPHTRRLGEALAHARDAEHRAQNDRLGGRDTPADPKDTEMQQQALHALQRLSAGGNRRAVSEFYMSLAKVTTERQRDVVAILTWQQTVRQLVPLFQKKLSTPIK